MKLKYLEPVDIFHRNNQDGLWLYGLESIGLSALIGGEITFFRESNLTKEYI